SSSSSSSAPQPTEAGSIKFLTQSFSIPETVAKIQMTVVRNGGSRGKVEVRWGMKAVTATADEDYYPNEGTLTFADGETEKTITFLPKDDTVGENPETLEIVLSSPTGGAVIGTTGTATIRLLDNEGGPSATPSAASSTAGGSSSAASGAGSFDFSAPKYAVQENGKATIIVRRNGGTTGAVTVTFATSDGTASSAKDYSPSSGTLSFAAGETSKTFTVNGTDNVTIEGNRSVNLRLSSPTGGAVLGGQQSATLLVVDDETSPEAVGSFQFPFGEEKLSKGTVFTVLIMRVAGSKGAAAVNYATSDGTAVGGTDFTAVSGTMSFEDGEVQKSFTVTILPGARADRQFNVTLSAPTGGAGLGANPTMAMKIQ
ncbi:MAG: hypothetical protein Greene041619_969, partial [Candidatus Peregrinibacteria bacterium Greene0416_19]